MTKAALLPLTGDPFLFKAWIDRFNNCWGKEVDRLYILLNASLDESIINYCADLISDSVSPIVLSVERKRIDHGAALTRLLEQVKEEAVLLIEEDGFIFKPGIVAKCFKEIEDNDVDLIGSPRGCCSNELWEKENLKWPETPQQEPNFWPNFLFVRKADLLKTDCQFGSKGWKKGDYIKPLDLTVQSDVIASDTFVWASIQLRSLGLRIKLLPQYHAMVEDLELKDKIQGVFDRKAPWIHFGSSSTWQDILLNPVLPALHGRSFEWEPRAAMWLMAWQEAQKDLSTLRDFSKQYKIGIDRLIREYELSEARVKYRADSYHILTKGIT